MVIACLPVHSSCHHCIAVPTTITTSSICSGCGNNWSSLIDTNWGNCFTCSMLSLLLLWYCLFGCTKYELTWIAGIDTASKGDDNSMRSVGEIGKNTVNKINQLELQAYIASLA